jgi:lactate racemase
LKIQLSYGRQIVSFSFPSFAVIPEFSEPVYTISREVFEQDLIRCLPKERDKYRQVAIVVSDKTRLCGYPEYLPWLTNLLTQHGAKQENIIFYIAYGTHQRQSEEESQNSYGSVYKEYQFIHHDCRDNALFEYHGITKRGTKVMIRRDILNSTLLITFGAISHHYFAGYGGGRKLLFPGLGARESVYHNHGLFLDRETRSLASGCQPGKLEDNPLAEDLQEVDTRMPPRISIHGILNTSGKVCQLIIGKNYSDFVAACQVHDGFYKLNSTQQYDLIVASSGGYPKDINFIQAHKSVHHAAAFVRDGGRLVMLSECTDKIGSDYFLKYLQAGSFEAAFSMLENNYEGNGGTALSMMDKTKRIAIYMLTSLDEDICNTLGVTKVTVNDIEKMITSETGNMAVIKNASILVI